MKLTEEEKELILKQRAKKKAAEPIKSGVLQHDLFKVCDSFAYYTIEIDVSEMDSNTGWETEEGIDKISALCREQLLRSDKIPKGTKFFCYMTDGGGEWVGDSGYSGYAFYNDWAAEHLEDIKEIKGDN
jgi:hypothetical protein